MTNSKTIAILYTGINLPDEQPDVFAHPALQKNTAPTNTALTHIPMLESRPIEFDRAHVQNLLQKPAAIVFYSQIAVRYMLDQGLFTHIDLSNKTFWAVGKKTAQLIEQELHVSVHVPPDENYEGLKIAFETAPLPPTLLALSLQGVHRDFSDVCTRRGIAFEDVSVYETSAIGADLLAKTLQNSIFDWIVFTSPRGVQIFFEHLKSFQNNALKDTDSLLKAWHMAAIGPSTQKAIENAGYTAHLTVDAPDRNLIVSAILNY